MATLTLLYFVVFLIGGTFANVPCSGGKVWDDCGSACPETCATPDSPFPCPDVCVSGCFCPEGLVDNFGTCINASDCPGACSGGRVWDDCGSLCPVTCTNYGSPLFCPDVCVSGCFCPEGLVDNFGTCINASDCPNPCLGEKVWNTCGSACPDTCATAYGSSLPCPDVCVSGCYCPEGTVDNFGTCVNVSDCPNPCSGGKVWNNCGPTCPDTCVTNDSPLFCPEFCVTGCFCPEGLADNNGTCINASDCPDIGPICSGGKVWDDCGSACPVTCANYDRSFPCSDVCVSGCFCPEGTVDYFGTCVNVSDCINTVPACPPGMVWDDCGSACPDTCATGSPPIFCPELCVPGCFCPEGLVEDNGVCINASDCPNTCPEGKVWNPCGSACPPTCDTFGRPTPCTLECVPGCYCPYGMVDNNGTCIRPLDCPNRCSSCREGQICTFSAGRIAICRDPYAVPCSVEESLSCPSNARCLANDYTGDTFCQESCYLNNGGCSDNQICYSTRTGDRSCNPLIEACYEIECRDLPRVQGRCPPGWILNECGSLCQRTCEDYLFDTRQFCPEICAPAACICPDDMVVFRDRCVDPQECYTLIYATPPGLNPLPIPEDVLLIQISLRGVLMETFNVSTFARLVGEFVRNTTFADVSVSVHAVFPQSGNVIVVLRFEGESIVDQQTSAEDLVSDIVMSNAGRLNVTVDGVSPVDADRVSTDEETGGESKLRISVATLLISSLIMLLQVH